MTCKAQQSLLERLALQSERTGEANSYSSSPQAGDHYASSAYRQPGWARARQSAGPLALAGLLLIAGAPAKAQDGMGLLSPGDAVVTGFSGTTDAGSVDKTFIDLDGPSMQILPLGASGVTPVKLMSTPAGNFQIKAGQIGQVFGIALDDGASNDGLSPNIYLGASSAFGIQIVTPDSDDDGLPERTITGAPGATFMSGQFGIQDGAGPGTIWEVDGVTGEVSVFATVSVDGKTNSGPGLGNIAYDNQNHQLFVSDRDTGMIHRVSADGTLLDYFDHGVTGRTSGGLSEVADDVTDRMNIQDPAFNSEDPSTWGLTAPQRRVWGVAVNNGRLYYAVTDGPQIWSVGIDQDGSFADDARKEFDVNIDGEPHPITDMVFDERGLLYLAQRGGLQSSYDYSIFAAAKQSKVLRYQRNSPEIPVSWSPVPEEYAIGMPPNHMNASGGIDLGHGYDKAGRIDRNNCNFLWSTGDALLTEPVIHGLQGNAASLVRPANTPPANAVFVDYDGKFADLEKQGHVGDVEVFRSCIGEQAEFVPTDGHSDPPIHLKSRSHWKYASHGHAKWRSHYKYASHGHSKWRSHYKYASRGHTKRRSHWKRASRRHTKKRSHWKRASRRHTKKRSHWKRASRRHTKKRSHWKRASRRHTKKRSHWKRASRRHTKKRSHYKRVSQSHTKRRSHYKRGSRGTDVPTLKQRSSVQQPVLRAQRLMQRRTNRQRWEAGKPKA